VEEELLESSSLYFTIQLHRRDLLIIIDGKVHRGWLSSTSISDLLQLSDESLVLGIEEEL
jgi:hypothetical protein